MFLLLISAYQKLLVCVWLYSRPIVNLHAEKQIRHNSAGQQQKFRPEVHLCSKANLWKSKLQVVTKDCCMF